MFHTWLISDKIFDNVDISNYRSANKTIKNAYSREMVKISCITKFTILYIAETAQLANWQVLAHYLGQHLQLNAGSVPALTRYLAL